jgi:hypothetical protein
MPQANILGLALGYIASRSLHVANDLGVADALKDGPRSVEALASATGSHAPSLHRLLRMLAGHGVFRETDPGHFALTPAAALLQRDTPGSLHDAVAMIGDLAGDGSWWRAVGAMRENVRTGRPAFEDVTGQGFFEYVQQRPECGRWFDRGLACFTSAENAAIANAHDFSAYRSIVDVGGGPGGLLAEILKAHPRVSGVLFDLPHVTPTHLREDALVKRSRIVSGDFFDAVPSGGSAYVLKRILHDWSDPDCVRILGRCREAIGATRARVLVIDAVIPAGNDFHPAKDMDMLMMMFASGRERTEVEFRELFSAAGFKVTRVLPTPTVLSIIEGEPR